MALAGILILVGVAVGAMIGNTVGDVVRLLCIAAGFLVTLVALIAQRTSPRNP